MTKNLKLLYYGLAPMERARHSPHDPQDRALAISTRRARVKQAKTIATLGGKPVAFADGTDRVRVQFIEKESPPFGIVHSMNIAELIFEKSRGLTAELQQEALDFVDFLSARQNAAKDARDWTRFSSEELSRQYASTDAVYDQD